MQTNYVRVVIYIYWLLPIKPNIMMFIRVSTRNNNIISIYLQLITYGIPLPAVCALCAKSLKGSTNTIQQSSVPDS